MQEFSALYSPESNGKAERLNRTLLDMSRTMVVAAAALPNKNGLLAEAVNFSNHLCNRMFTSAGNYKDMPPFECITREKPDLSNIRIFGGKAYAHIPKAKRQGKFERRADKGFCAGVGFRSGYRVFVPELHALIISKDVDFDDTNATVRTPADIEPVDELWDIQESCDKVAPQPIPSVSSMKSVPSMNDTVPTVSAMDLTHVPNLRRSSRTVRPPLKYTPNNSAMVLALVHQMGSEDPHVPLTYKQAVECSEREK